MYYHVSNNGIGYERDDEEPCGRVLSQSEYTEKLKARTDIFTIDKNYFLRKTEAFCLSLALLFGFWLPGMDVMTMPIDMIAPPLNFVEPPTRTPVIAVIKEPIDLKTHYTKTVDRPKIMKRDNAKRSLKQGSGRRGTGGGNYRARIMKQGFLGLAHGHVRGGEVYSDIFAKGGFAENIDAILSGVGSLKKGRDGGVGRKGIQGIGFGNGNTSGFGSDPGNIDASLDNMMQPEPEVLDIRKGSLIDFNKRNTPWTTGKGIRDGRNKGEIARVVLQNMSALRYAYNKRLREKPGLNGKVCLRFAIDEFGKVIFCEVVNSSMNDAPFEKLMVAKIKKWVFDKIDMPGDVTEVVYPFVFSM